MKKIIAVFAIIAVLIGCFAACSGGKEGNSQNGELFDSFETIDFEGNTVNEKVFKGKKVTMLNIWGTFCSSCIREMPALNTLNETYADKGLQVIGIVCDVPLEENGKPNESKLNEAKEILRIREAEYMNIFPFEEMYSTVLAGSYSVPVTYFVDENGKQIGESYLGSKDLEAWQKIVDSVLAQVE